MKIDFKKLQEIGAFVGAPVEKTIKWTLAREDGTTEDFEGVVYIRRNSCATFERDIKAHMAGQEAAATKISTNVCDENGNPILTYEQALDLAEPLAAALLAKIIEVNAPKNSNPPTNSGTNSSSQASAGEQSQKRNET